MKRIILVIGLVSSTCFTIAQDESTTISESLTDLETPANPALTLMGIQPLEISQPKSIRQLETTLINSFVQDGRFVIPQNFALEVMPFWLKPHPNKVFDYDKLTKNESKPLENLSLSVGSVNKQDGDTTKTQLGFGLRTLIFSGKITDSNADTIKYLSEVFRKKTMIYTGLITAATRLMTFPKPTYQALKDTLITIVDNFEMDDAQKAAAKKELGNGFSSVLAGASLSTTINPADQTQFLTSLIEYYDKVMNSTDYIPEAAKIQDLQIRKYGLSWEVATASYLDFPTGNWELSYVPKLGIWSTLSYKLPKQNFNFLGLARHIWDFQNEDIGKSIDLGGSLVWTPKNGKFSVSGEYIYREEKIVLKTTDNIDGSVNKETKHRYDYRLAFNASYKITEKIIVAYSFGKTFDSTLSTNNNLISQLTVDFGFGQVPLVLDK